MKKMLKIPFILIITILLSVTSCLAGDIPEALLMEESAQVYFGEVKSIEGEFITIIQRQHIKGEFTEGHEQTYTSFAFTNAPIIGTIYLCGYLDEMNPLYIWEVSSLNTKELTIENTDSLSQRMQKYLNEGEFEAKEHERLAKIQSDKLLETSTDQTKVTNQGESYISTEMIVIGMGIVLLGGLLIYFYKRK